MRIFKDLKLAEQIGSGMRRILSVYDKSAFDITENFLRVTFYYDKKTTSDVRINVGINDTQQKIIQNMSRNERITFPELALALGISERQIQRNVKKLSDLGVIARTGSRKSGSWVINDPTLTHTDEERALFEEIAPLAKQLQTLYKKIDKMLADGLITREQYDEMMYIPEEEDEKNS